MNRRRLDGEAIRDALLAASGTLNRTVGGPMVRVPLEPESYAQLFTEGEPDGLWLVTPDAKQHARRSLYLMAKRNVRLPLLEVFDQPDRQTPCGRRAVSTFAPQALVLMNGPFAREQAAKLGAKLLADHPADAADRIASAYVRVYGRSPRAAEAKAAAEFLADQKALIAGEWRRDGKPADGAAAAALADFCLALVNANEFVVVP